MEATIHKLNKNAILQPILSHTWMDSFPAHHHYEGMRGAIHTVHTPSFKLLQELEIPTSNIHNTMQFFLTNHN